jgi:hypothetical protein
MKIAVLGGTGDLGKGLVVRWSRKHDVLVGSRYSEKAKKLANEYREVALNNYESIKGSIEGDENTKVIKDAEVIVISIPYEYLINFLKMIKPFFSNDKVIISPIAPFKKIGKAFSYVKIKYNGKQVSAGEAIAEILESNKVVSAFQTVPAPLLANPKLRLDYDIPICGDDKEALSITTKLIEEIENLKAIYCGPITCSCLVECITPLLLNVARYGKVKEPSIKFVGF